MKISGDLDLIEIDFYHVDAFEVNIFLPIYKSLIDLGIKPRPLLLDDSISSVSSGYLDIEKCKLFYKENNIEYFETPNYSNPVCSTQGAEFLTLYYGLRIRIPYGLTTYPKAWGFSRKSVLGFDTILVHGEYYKSYLTTFTSNKNIFVAGYPRYDAFFNDKSYNKLPNYALNLNPDLTTILFLPTWGKDSALNDMLELSITLKERFNILVKPHHLSVSREISLIESYRDLGVSILIESHDLVSSMSLSDIIVCDVRSSVFGESILIDKKTIGLVRNESDYEWLDKYELSQCAYIASDINEVTVLIKKYAAKDKFEISRGVWASNRSEFSDGTSSQVTAGILKDCVNNNHASSIKKIFRKSFALVFTVFGVNVKISTKIVSYAHLLVIKILGNFK